MNRNDELQCVQRPTGSDQRQMLAFWEPKLGLADSDWEDGAAYSLKRRRFAVADGASAGNRSREWAFTLVREFVRNGPTMIGGLEDREVESRRWLRSIQKSFEPDEHEFPESTMPTWIQNASRERGAFSTLLGGSIDATHLNAVSIGDCCLFLVGARNRPQTFPLTSAKDFGSTPDLVASSTEYPLPELKVLSIDIATTDMVYVASDALSAWLVDRLGQDEVWHQLQNITSAAFRELCDKERAAKRMTNDDVTLLRIGRVER